MFFSNGESTPYGTITAWYGSLESIPTGWQKCDGTNGTPDLRGRVIVCQQNGSPHFNSVNYQGGELEHTLLVSEMPAHSHSGGSSSGGADVGAYNYANTTSTGSQGGGGAHNNLQPYHVLHYIMKV